MQALCPVLGYWDPAGKQIGLGPPFDKVFSKQSDTSSLMRAMAKHCKQNWVPLRTVPTVKAPCGSDIMSESYVSSRQRNKWTCRDGDTCPGLMTGNRAEAGPG